MAQHGKGRVILHKRGGVYIYVPKEVASDSSFMFKEGGDVSIHIRGGRLIVEPAFRGGEIEERKLNYCAYVKVRDKLVEKCKGMYAVIADGEVQSIASSAEEAIRKSDKKLRESKH